MLLVAVAWIYVVGLMALTEPSIVAGIMTFFSYCVLPLSIFYYIFGRPKRGNRRPVASQVHTGEDVDAKPTEDNEGS